MDCPICGCGRYSCRCRESDLRDYDRQHHYEMDYDADRFVHDRIREKEDDRWRERQHQEEQRYEERMARKRAQEYEEEMQRAAEEYWSQQSQQEEKAWPDPPTPEPEPDEEGK